MANEIKPDGIAGTKPLRFKFHPLVRIFMIILGAVAAGYSVFFITKDC